ncbi:MAG: hypothetical protein ABSC89_09280 [Verrucomicrobiota bacterium]
MKLRSGKVDRIIPSILNAPGTSLLIIAGREANVQLQGLSILQLPPPPLNLHIAPSL